MATRTVSIDRWPKKLRLPCSHSRLAAARLSFASAARSFHATGFRELGQRHPATPPPRHPAVILHASPWDVCCLLTVHVSR